METNLPVEKIAFLSIAFGDQRYSQQLERLEKSIWEFYPGIDLVHPKGENRFFYWINGDLPQGAKPFSESLYGFKVHAVKHALNAGFTKIVWLDPACILKDKVDYYFDIIRPYGILAFQDENKLCNHCDDRTYNYFGVDIKVSENLDQRLVGGSAYFFDFDLPLCWEIFSKWRDAEAAGIFGTQRELSSGKINRCRSDESAMALALYTSNSRPITIDVAKYLTADCIIDKKHFK